MGGGYDQTETGLVVGNGFFNEVKERIVLNFPLIGMSPLTYVGRAVYLL
jgi:hypothetical protein